VQEDRLGSAQKLSEQFQCTVVLKGSGTVVAEPGQTTAINPTGNALLATAGTGDVLAGWIGAYMAQGLEGYGAACAAVWSHGRVADNWSLGTQGPLTASKLACASSG
jgi:NAD(P)H-hydrate repair Nnr-like enzyme with NAD(P)H-hydrate dehydratase domain